MASQYKGAVVIGAGPNGLAAAITLQRAGIPVLILEGRSTVGGGTRSAELTLPGFQHDVCSAVHVMATVSPFFRSLPLKDFGLEWIHPPVLAAHPFDDGHAVCLMHSPEETAEQFAAQSRKDERTYRRLIGKLLPSSERLFEGILGPLAFPPHPFTVGRFGLRGLQSASHVAQKFKSPYAQGFFAGMAAHSMQPLSAHGTSAIAMALLLGGHAGGWPIVRGGSQKLADAMAAYFISIGGRIQTGAFVRSLDDLPAENIVLFDTSVQQLEKIAGDRLSRSYRSKLQEFRPGPGIFKVDWALSAPAPFKAALCRKAGTVHLGGTLQEIEASELDANESRISRKPFVLFVQPSLFDSTRAPEGKHTAWAYCHVPNNSYVDMTDAIELQVERFAPGFKSRILHRHVMGPAAFEAYNPNYVGGDINGGAMDLAQTFARPTSLFSPYNTSAPDLYLCSASTPPGGGVHGQCGYHAALHVLKDHFPENIYSINV